MSDIGSRFGVNTYGYTQAMTATDCLRHLAERGVRAVELMFYPGHLWIDEPAETIADIRRVLAETGIELVSMNGPNIDLNIAAATAEMRDMSIGLNRRYLEIAGDLGAAGLIFGPGKANPLFPLPNDFLEGHFHAALDALLPVAEKVGVELWIENMPFAFLPDAKSMMASIDRYGSDRLKVCYDVANAHFIGEDPVECLGAVASRLALVHLSDTTRTHYRHDAVGDGDIDFARLPRAIEKTGCGREPMLEIIAREPDDAIADSARRLEEIGL